MGVGIGLLISKLKTVLEKESTIVGWYVDPLGIVLEYFKLWDGRFSTTIVSYVEMTHYTNI